jgi:cytochrome c oxidase subunit II
VSPGEPRRGSVRRRACWLALLATLALVVAACSTESGPENGQNALRPKGPEAQQIDNLFTPIFWIAVGVGVFIIGATLFVAIKYRQRKGADERPKQIHGNTPLEIGWTLLPALILAVIAVPTVSVIFDQAEPPTDPLEVTSVGKQWWWQFDYPKQAGVDRKIVTANDMHIPTGRDVYVKLTACDDSLPGGADNNPGCNVIHSFWVPELAGTKDVVPGRTSTVKLRADEPGTFLGQCKEYCGLSPANMRFRVIADTPDDFADWVAGQNDPPAVALDDSDAGQLFTEKFQCTNCHTTEDSSASVYGPNLTHLASRTTFASGYYELTREKLVEWILNAPSLIPMESEDCRKPPSPFENTCVGMPSFTENTPEGQPTMTQAEAETLADYLLELT